MSITPFLDGERFDLEGERVLRLAFEMVCIALRTGDCDDHVKQAIATKLIALAKAGERNPDRLCEEAVKDIRTPQQWAASEAAKSSVLSDSTWGLVSPERRTRVASAAPRSSQKITG
jgi:hypothetical protein